MNMSHISPPPPWPNFPGNTQVLYKGNGVCRDSNGLAYNYLTKPATLSQCMNDAVSLYALGLEYGSFGYSVTPSPPPASPPPAPPPP